MSFAIFAICEVFLYHDNEKSRGLFFNKILSNKHTAAPIFNLTKHSVGCGIDAICTILNKIMSINLTLPSRYKKEIQKIKANS